MNGLIALEMKQYISESDQMQEEQFLSSSTVL